MFDLIGHWTRGPSGKLRNTATDIRKGKGTNCFFVPFLLCHFFFCRRDFGGVAFGSGGGKRFGRICGRLGEGRWFGEGGEEQRAAKKGAKKKSNEKGEGNEKAVPWGGYFC